MRIELEQSDIEAIAACVVTMLRPMLPPTTGKADDDCILDIDGLCLHLGMSKKWVYDRIAEKSLPHFKLGHVLKFRKRDVEKWLRSFDVPAVRPAPFVNNLRTIK